MDKIHSEIPFNATIIEDGAKKVVALDAIEVGNILELKEERKQL